MSTPFPAAQQPIAVIGASAVLPSTAGVASYWQNILSARELMRDVPDRYFALDDYYDADPLAADRTYCSRGGFIPPLLFDPIKYGIPPRVIETTDPAQLLGVILAEQVLNDATQGDWTRVDRERVSVILGSAGPTGLLGEMSARLGRPKWKAALLQRGYSDADAESLCDQISSQFPEWRESTFPGLLGNVIAGRIANRLDLGGTNCLVDAACAGSLAALTMAVSELQLGRSDMVIAGGVDALNLPLMYLCFSKTPALSRQGKCRPFTADADGTLLGEGIVMLALKRLADAERDGDRLYAVIRAIGSSSDGKAKSIYAPVAEGQAKAVRRCYALVDISPSTVELVEAHGTATRAGDQAEFSGLSHVFGPTRSDRQWCALGSVKSQIGHTKGTAGVAGLLKAVLALHHRVLPPMANVSTPNPALEIEQSPFYLNSTPRPWVRGDDHPRRAGVSSFGFGGTNFHVLVEEYRGPASLAARVRTSPTEVFLACAADVPALQAALTKLVDEVTEHGEQRALFTALAARSQQTFDPAAEHRLALVAKDPAELAELANAWRSELDAQRANAAGAAAISKPGLYYRQGAEAGRVAWLFPGQGGQYVQMGRDLAIEYPEVLEVWDRAAAIGMNLHDVVFPKPVYDEDARRGQTELLQRTEWSQPAIGAVSLGLARLLSKAGLRPDFTAGHSFGELSALCCAGAFSGVDLLRLARRRGELMAGADRGGMTAVQAPPATVIDLIREHGDPEVTAANFNSPAQLVIAGPIAALEKFEALLRTKQIAWRRLPVSAAFHSPLVADAVQPLFEALRTTPIGAPQLPVFSNATAAPYPADPSEVRSGLSAQVTQPVRFTEIIENLYQEGVRTFIEVGSGKVLSSLVKQCLEGRGHQAIPLDDRQLDGRTALQFGLAQLAVLGARIRWDQLWEGFALAEIPAPAAKSKSHALWIDGATTYLPYRENRLALKSVSGSPSLSVKEAPMPPSVPPTPAPPPAPTPRPSSSNGHAATSAHAAATVQPTTSAHSAAFAPVVAPSAVDACPAVAASGGEVQNHALHDGLLLATLSQWNQQLQSAQKSYQETLAGSYHEFLGVMQRSLERVIALSGGAAADAAVHFASTSTTESYAAHPTSPLTAPAAPIIVAQHEPVVVPDTLSAAKPVSTAPPHQAPVAERQATAVPPPVADSLSLRFAPQSPAPEPQSSPPPVSPPSVPAAAPSTAAAVAIPTPVRSVPAAIGDRPLAAPAAPTFDPGLQKQLLEVVAEKTGYPIDLLDLNAGIESELGVDSIKRVEIFSTLSQQVPGLENVDPAELLAQQTLGDVLMIASRILGKPTAAPAPLAAPVPLAAPAPVAAPAMAPVVPAPIAPAYSAPPAYTNGNGSRPAAAVAAAPVSAFAPPPVEEYDPVMKAALLAIVAEKTGYPTDLLDLDTEIEAGLGVDSIKRVEIFSALAQQTAGLENADPAELLAQETLGDVLRAVRRLLGGPQGPFVLAAEGTSLPPRSISQPRAIRVFEVELQPAPAAGFALPGLVECQRIELIVGKPSPDAIAAPVAAAVRDRLQSHGLIVDIVTSATPAAEGVLDLTGLDPVISIEAAIDRQRAAFFCAQSFLRGPAETRRVFVTVAAQGGDFGLSGRQSLAAWQGGLAGLVKTIRCERANTAVKAIDLELAGQPVEMVAESIVRELFAGGLEVEVALHASGERFTLGTREHVPASQAQSIGASQLTGVPQGAVVLVSGGARGVTTSALADFVREVRPRLVLLGRTPLAAEPAWATGLATEPQLKEALIRAWRTAGRTFAPKDVGSEVARVVAVREITAGVEQLTALGATVRYAAVDVLDGPALGDLCAEVRREWGPIAGIVHAAGVLADKRLEDKTPAQFDRVFRTKVQGLANLLSATQRDPLRMLVMFSSIAGRTGNIGQGDYAMANEVLNKVAAGEAARRGSECRVRSLGWGPWQGGMVTPSLEAHFRSLGVELVTPAEGSARFLESLVIPGHGGVEFVLAGSPELPQHVDESRTQSVDLALCRATHPYLLGHQIQGVVVVPAVLVVEWFFRLGEQLCKPGERVLACEDFQVKKGIRIDDFTALFTLRMTWRHAAEIAAGAPHGAVGTRQMHVELRSLSGVMHYSARIIVGPADSAPGSTPVQPPRLFRERWGLSLDAAYAQALFHTDAFQAIRELEGVSREGGSGWVESSSRRGWTGGPWLVEPAALDACLQLALLWGFQYQNQTALPSRIGRVVLHQPAFGDRRLRAEVITKRSSNFDNTFDVHLADEAGQRVLTMHDLVMTLHITRDAHPRASTAARPALAGRV